MPVTGKPKRSRPASGYERLPLSATVRREVYRRHGYVCHLCGKPIDAKLRFPSPFSASIDHLLPVSKGGSDRIENLLPSHLGCNSLRSNRELDTHRAGMIASSLTRAELFEIVSTGLPIKFGPRYYLPRVDGYIPKGRRRRRLFAALRDAWPAIKIVSLLMAVVIGGIFVLYAGFHYAPAFTFWVIVITLGTWFFATSGRRRRRARARRSAATRRRRAMVNYYRQNYGPNARTRIIDASQRPRRLTRRARYLSRHIAEWEVLAEEPERYLIPGVGVGVRSAD